MSNTSSPPTTPEAFTTTTETGRLTEVDLRRSLVAMQVVMAEFDPTAIPVPDVTAIFTLFAHIGRLAGNGQTLLPSRLNDANDWDDDGQPTLADWVAKTTGTTVGEHDLLDTAQTDSTKNLKDQAARRKAQARSDDAEETARRHHRERKASAWRGADGKYNFGLEGPIAATAAFNAAWEREIDRQYRTAQKAGRREPRDAYAFDAFLALTQNNNSTATSTDGPAPGPAPRPSPKHLALIRVDLSALVRGTVQGDEICEVAGIGPISVTEARNLLGDSILHLVSENGIDVQNITHLGRGPNAAQTLALLWTSQQCTVLGCHRTHTENDHRIDDAHTKHTRLDELDPLCDHHHDRKTLEGWALVTGNGRRRFVPPDHHDHPGHQQSSPSGTPVAPELAQRARRAHERAQRVTPGPETMGSDGHGEQGEHEQDDRDGRGEQGHLFDTG